MPRDHVEQRPIIIASNRGPVRFHRTVDGALAPDPAGGGLATALVSAAAHDPFRWVAVAGTPADRAATPADRAITVTVHDVEIPLRLVHMPDAIYQWYYEEIGNRLLWFFHHYLLEPERAGGFDARLARAWQQGFLPASDAIATGIVEEIERLSVGARERALVLLQDYHLSLVPERIRRHLPQVALGHFIHIPWPTHQYWELLPRCLTRHIFESMARNTLIGFQTPTDVENFLACAQAFLPGARLQRADGRASLAWRQHITRVGAYPIAIAPDRVRELAGSPAAEASIAPLLPLFDRRVVLRVDRLDPTKNITLGLDAFEVLLTRHPELVGQVRFLLLLMPAREGIARNRAYARRVRLLVRRINRRFATAETGPVVIALEGHDQLRALAAMRRCDVMLVNSLMDGMSLVAKEAAVVTAHDAVLIVSRSVGAFQELGEDACLSVSPLDVLETAEAMYHALTLPADRRRALAEAARSRVGVRSVTEWLRSLLTDLADASAD